MMGDVSLPHPRELTPERQRQRREHLMREIAPKMARSRLRTLRMPVAIGTGAATLVIAAAAGALGHSAPKLATASLSDGERLTLSHLSANGTPVDLPSGDVRAARLRAAGYKNITQIAARGDMRFFRLDSASGRACFGVGRQGADWPFAAIVCRTTAPYFPSAEVPLLDQSTVESTAPTGPLHFANLEGIAADGVVAVQGIDPSGNVSITAPVDNNVYYVPSTEMPSNVISIQATDSSGRIIASLPR
jgi:hypothetical protein